MYTCSTSRLGALAAKAHRESFYARCKPAIRQAHTFSKRASCQLSSKKRARSTEALHLKKLHNRNERHFSIQSGHTC